MGVCNVCCEDATVEEVGGIVVVGLLELAMEGSAAAGGDEADAGSGGTGGTGTGACTSSSPTCTACAGAAMGTNVGGLVLMMTGEELVVLVELEILVSARVDPALLSASPPTNTAVVASAALKDVVVAAAAAASISVLAGARGLAVHLLPSIVVMLAPAGSPCSDMMKSNTFQFLGDSSRSRSKGRRVSKINDQKTQNSGNEEKKAHRRPLGPSKSLQRS